METFRPTSCCHYLVSCILCSGDREEGDYAPGTRGDPPASVIGPWEAKVA